jgi:MFS family permease
VGELLDEAATGAFHRRAVVVSGVGFFTDAYDLFVISVVATIVVAQWHLDTTQASWVNGSAILAAVAGALLFGRLADVLGRKRVYALVASFMIVGALASAVAPGFWWLVGSRFVLGLGIGGDYPVSAVLMSEYANRRDRGRLVGLVFSMQALGLVVGPVVAIALLGSGLGHGLVWRILLGLGALPAAAVVYLRTQMPESPRFTADVRGETARAVADLATFTTGAGAALVVAAQSGAAQSGAAPAGAVAGDAPWRRPLLAPRRLLLDPRLLAIVVGTAGSWFVFDYAYYGNTLSLPAILALVDPHATLLAKLVWTLGMFVVFAVPGYALAVWRMDRIGHRRLQLVGFAVLAVAFALLGSVHVLTTTVAPFLGVFGLTYLFVEFGPNTTTFVLPSELFPTELRATGHGIASGVGKLGAFAGVFLVPTLETHLGLSGMLLVAAGFAGAGVLLTMLLPEAAGRRLDDLSPVELPSAFRAPVDPAPGRTRRAAVGETAQAPAWNIATRPGVPHTGTSP